MTTTLTPSATERADQLLGTTPTPTDDETPGVPPMPYTFGGATKTGAPTLNTDAQVLRVAVQGRRVLLATVDPLTLLFELAGDRENIEQLYASMVTVPMAQDGVTPLGSIEDWKLDGTHLPHWEKLQRYYATGFLPGVLDHIDWAGSSRGLHAIDAEQMKALGNSTAIMKRTCGALDDICGNSMLTDEFFPTKESVQQKTAAKTVSSQGDAKKATVATYRSKIESISRQSQGELNLNNLLIYYDAVCELEPNHVLNKSTHDLPLDHPLTVMATRISVELQPHCDKTEEISLTDIVRVITSTATLEHLINLVQKTTSANAEEVELTKLSKFVSELAGAEVTTTSKSRTKRFKVSDTTKPAILKGLKLMAKMFSYFPHSVVGYKMTACHFFLEKHAAMLELSTMVAFVTQMLKFFKQNAATGRTMDAKMWNPLDRVSVQALNLVRGDHTRPFYQQLLLAVDGILADIKICELASKANAKLSPLGLAQQTANTKGTKPTWQNLPAALKTPIKDFTNAQGDPVYKCMKFYRGPSGGGTKCKETCHTIRSNQTLEQDITDDKGQLWHCVVCTSTVNGVEVPRIHTKKK